MQFVPFRFQTTELHLEEMRSLALHGIVVILQKYIRRWIAVRYFKRVRRFVILMQACARREIAVRKYRRAIDAVITIQAFMRMVSS
jgi:myosin heavy subunit